MECYFYVLAKWTKHSGKQFFKLHLKHPHHSYTFHCSKCDFYLHRVSIHSTKHPSHFVGNIQENICEIEFVINLPFEIRIVVELKAFWKTFISAKCSENRIVQIEFLRKHFYDFCFTARVLFDIERKRNKRYKLNFQDWCGITVLLIELR